ncbi:uncharacterized protein LOC134445314 [Engraulis encrasicolus]|uniref:uncharacterized protein LOC134445314 n=1 Tax=Engraulis encrasicolus TaxID=184585 RepID=UPI002FD26755
MAFCPKTFNQSGSWIGAGPHTRSERVFSHLNSAEEMDMASHWRPQSEHPYKYVRATRFSSSKYWKEHQKEHATSQEQQYHGMTNLPTSAPQTLRFVGNLIHPQSTSARGNRASTEPLVTPVRKDISFVEPTLPNMASTCPSNMTNLIPTTDGSAAVLSQLGRLTFVGNVNLPAEVFHGQQNIIGLKPAQSPGIMTHGGLAVPRVDAMSSTSAAPASLSHGAFGGAPTAHSQTAGFHYSREELLKMINLHGEMMAKYRELRGKAENIEKLMRQSVCPAEHQGKTESIQGRSWKEEAKASDDLTGDIVLPEDAMEKLEAIPGILDLAREMGFLTMC